MESIKIGDMVGWLSAAGYREGLVKNIVLVKNAADGLVPWIDVKYKISGRSFNSVRICATESNLNMMKLEVL